MTEVQSASPTRSAGSDRLEQSCVAVILALALAVRLWVPVDSNIAWLLSVARAVRDGADLYVDIVETNPPMAVWLHLPAVWLERLVGVGAEPAYVAMVFALGVGVAVHLADRFATAGVARRFDRPIMLAAFVLLPLTTFAERDQVALLLIVPMIATSALRLAGKRPRVADIVVAGFAAGLAVMIKPQFAAPVAALAIAGAVSLRSMRPLLAPEALIAAAAFFAYAGAVLRGLPAYGADVVPIMVDLYRPARFDVLTLIGEVKLAKLLLIAAQLAMLLYRGGWAPGTSVLLAAAAGFTASYLDQGRAGAYQLVPATSLVLIATLRLVPAALAARDRSLRLVGASALAAALWALPDYARFIYPNPTIVAAIRAAVAHPTVAAISIDLTPAHPITTAVDGRWVGTYSSRWITGHAALRRAATRDPDARARADTWARHDRAVTNSDLATRRPDIVIVGDGWDQWIAADAETARLMAAYRLLIREPTASDPRFEPIAVWIRADLLPAKVPHV